MTADTASVQHNEPMVVTKLRNFRVDDEIWERAQKIAADRRETVSAVLKRALVEYVERYEK
jgi:predicted transcriptional regulator